MRPTIISPFLLLLLGLCACAPPSGNVRVSMSTLIETPEQFDGRRVEVEGFMMVSWEGGGVFCAPSDERTYNTAQGVRLRVPTKILGPLDRYDGTFGTVVGVFERDQSHGWRGTITVKEIRPSFRFRPVARPVRATDGRDPEERLRDSAARRIVDRARMPSPPSSEAVVQSGPCDPAR